MTIEYIDDLYCVFDRTGRIIAAFETKEKAKAYIRKYYEKRKEA